jgi:hypothetical protein
MLDIKVIILILLVCYILKLSANTTLLIMMGSFLILNKKSNLENMSVSRMPCSTYQCYNDKEPNCKKCKYGAYCQDGDLFKNRLCWCCQQTDESPCKPFKP